MPECKQIRRMLSDYLDQNLPAEACGQVDEHLRSCSGCGESLRWLREAVSMCNQYRPEAVPSPLQEEKKSELREAFTRALKQLEG